MTTATYNPAASSIPLGTVTGGPSKRQATGCTVVGTTDLDLVRRIQTGSEKEREVAFSALYTRHQATAFNVAMRVVKSSEDAENVVQETFIKVNRNLHRFRGDSQFSTWLHTIAHNTALNYVAHEKRRPQSSGVDIKDLGTEHQRELGFGVSPLSEMEHEDLSNVLDRGLLSLTDDLKQTLLFVVQSGMSYEEVAQITDVPVGTVRSRVFRARRALDEYLTENLPGYRKRAK